MDHHQARELSELMVRFLETGTPPDGLFQPDVFCDFTLPQWRLQTQGIEGVVRIRKDGHPRPGRVARWRTDPTPDGFVMELEERWEDAGGPWYCREMIRVAVTDRQISEISVYCTGDWDKARQEEHARTVTLLRP
jgi:hypothetical protein